ncbi:MAG: DUF433 domain-containing protein [Isosphaeraceae bacterium]
MNHRDEILKRISIDPNVCFGRPCIRGTRIWVSLIVDNLADDVSEAERLEAYPQLKPFHSSGRSGRRLGLQPQTRRARNSDRSPPIPLYPAPGRSSASTRSGRTRFIGVFEVELRNSSGSSPVR